MRESMRLLLKIPNRWRWNGFPCILHEKVTLAAMLYKDGLLSDARVVKSSGQHGARSSFLEDAKNGPPIKLSHPLNSLTCR